MPHAQTASLILDQLSAFLEALALGFSLAAFYDLYRALRMQSRRRLRAAASFAADCLFWIIATLACIVVFTIRRWGEVYFYTYLGLGAGSTAYFYLFSRYILPVWNELFKHIFRVMQALFQLMLSLVRALTAPFRWASQYACRAAGKSRGLFSPCMSRIITLLRRNK